MKQISEFISKTKNPALSYEEHLKNKVDFYNSTHGALAGYNCEKCLNRGLIAEVRDGKEIFIECECIEKRRAFKRLKDSGIAGSIKEKTFSSFVDTEDFQKNMKSKAAKFVKSHKNKWFFIGGQNGCGKTHICTAIVGQLLKIGKSVRYLLWEEDVPILKSKVNEPEYKSLISDYQRADVLYIDDLFKSNATEADIRIAFQLLDYRSRNRLCTIISSERMSDEIYKINPAIGGRIIEKSTVINIPRDKRKDYRLKLGG